MEKEQVAERKLPSWFDESKLGIFIHWGLYAVPAFAPTTRSESLSLNAAEWYLRKLKMPFRDKSATRDYHKRTYGAEFEYEQFAQMWHAEKWDPDSWAKKFKEAGAQYVVFTSKHHDGFCNWPTDFTLRPLSSVKDTGPQRDLIAELSAAVRRVDIRFGLYFSLFEWYNSMYLSDKRRKSTDFVSTIVFPQLYELIETYKPDILWCDGDWEQSYTYWHAEDFFKWLYNESPVKDTIVCNDRWGKDARPVRFASSFSSAVDRMRPPTPPAYKFECCFTIGKSWGYNAMQKQEDYKPFPEVMEEMVRAVAFGGNFLLNVGPKANGELCEFDEGILTKLSRWMKVNSRAILCTQLLSSKYPSEVNRFGVIYFTKRDKDVFAFLFLKNLPPTRPELHIKCLRVVSSSASKCSLLTEKGDVEFKVEKVKEGGVSVVLPVLLSSFEEGPPVLRLDGVEVLE